MVNQAELYNRVSKGQFDCGIELIKMLKLKPGQKILDIGCGSGNLTFELAKSLGAQGQVVAIEPDAERIELAKQQTPKDIKNIVWHHGPLSSFQAERPETFQFAYSNYVFHWMNNQAEAVQNVYALLAPQGRFGFCCVYGMPKVIRDLCNAIGDEGKAITEALHFTPKDTWLSYFTDAGFKIELTNEVADYYFENINEVMVWWEATTHGVFSIDKLSNDSLEKIRSDYVGPISIYREETLRLVAVK